MDDKSNMKDDLLRYLGTGSYCTDANKLQGDRIFLKFIEKKYGMSLDEMLSSVGLDMSSMSMIAQTKSEIDVVCANCGKALRIADLKLIEADSEMRIIVAPCGNCINIAKDQEKEGGSTNC